LFIKFSNMRNHLQTLTLLQLGVSVLLETDGLDGDESSGVLGSESSDLVHGGLGHVVELLGLGGTSENLEVTLVDTAADGSVDGLLGGADRVLEELTLGGEVESVVEDLGVVVGDELVTESTDLTVEDESLKVDVSGTEDGKTGGLVASTGLESDETVLDDVDTSNSVAAGDSVGNQEEVEGLGNGLSVLVLKLDGKSLLELDGEVLGSVGGVTGVDGELPHVLGSLHVGVLKDSGLVRAVGKVLVHGPGLRLGLGDGNTNLLGVLEEVGTSSEALVEDGHAPGGDDLDVGLESVEGELETDLVVTLSGTSVGDGNTSLALGDGDLGAGNDGAGKGSSCGVL
jgi:hypothetical protein